MIDSNRFYNYYGGLCSDMVLCFHSAYDDIVVSYAEFNWKKYIRDMLDDEYRTYCRYQPI
jgi:hypothetical protein